MGVSGSRCQNLLERMGWHTPEFAEDVANTALMEYLENQNLEVTLPRHAPQCDISMADRKPAMYPRPSFCWEGYKMHFGVIGPSSACKRQLREFLPSLANAFVGPAHRLGPGREAVPHYFIDEKLHRLVLWELPEVNWKQGCEDYIREIGLMYCDVVLMLFSDKYPLSDIYCKMCVAMAIHGIPFFVLCTMSGDEMDDKAWHRLKSDFQKKDVKVRMFHPKKPKEFMQELINDVFKEVSWNRSERDAGITKNLDDAILGQTIRLKNIEKKPELNGRCGVCIGFDQEAKRYRVRIINSGVETDLALREDCISILKPKLVGSMVRLHGLESKPELNGRFGFVDEFLRDTERYRVFLPDAPGKALSLALKPKNLERVDSLAGAAPVAAPAREQPALGGAKAAPSKPTAKAAAPGSAAAPGPAAAAGQVDRPAREKPAVSPYAAAQAAGTNGASPAAWRGPPTPTAQPAAQPAAPPAAQAAKDGGAAAGGAADAGGYPPAPGPAAAPSPLAAALAAAASEAAASQGAPAPAPLDGAGQAQPDEGGPRSAEAAGPPTREALLGTAMWVVSGDRSASEDLMDHLMDCGKSVLAAGTEPSAFAQIVADLARHRKQPKDAVLTFVEVEHVAIMEIVREAGRVGFAGVVVSPDSGSYSAGVADCCRDAGIACFEVDLFTALSMT